jgi:hypothetical protein
VGYGEFVTFLNNAGLWRLTVGTTESPATTEAEIWIEGQLWLESISFPDLKVAKEMVIQHNESLESVSFPSLTNTTTSSIHLVDNASEGLPIILSFPLLESVGTNFELDGGGSGGGELNAVIFPNLALVPENLWVRNAPYLDTISFPNLLHVGNLEVWNNLGLDLFSAPGLATVTSSVVIDYSPFMNELVLTNLTSIGEDLVVDSTGLVTLDAFSALTSKVKNVEIIRNNNLTDVLGLDGIGDADPSDPLVSGTFEISQNIDLCEVQIFFLFDLFEDKDLGNSPWAGSAIQAGNLSDCAWPAPGLTGGASRGPEVDLNLPEGGGREKPPP